MKKYDELNKQTIEEISKMNREQKEDLFDWLLNDVTYLSDAYKDFYYQEDCTDLIFELIKCKEYLDDYNKFNEEIFDDEIEDFLNDEDIYTGSELYQKADENLQRHGMDGNIYLAYAIKNDLNFRKDNFYQINGYWNGFEKIAHTNFDLTWYLITNYVKNDIKRVTKQQVKEILEEQKEEQKEEKKEVLSF
ncbi:Mbov_0392 family ICE element protein [[Mycoplasma] gypis]|uniref:Uncharacterized protein n=1 Tax=[Mycoplasma] gypis TaxID=92404 RepID=A0ABZ2RQA2_9BACT|nr:hypothetical protein [[Mycoplasma] gypis]MBN0919398.1 hypothetical protein [[Mycoplasma] gypis]